ncbi:ABC transporter substrate-binding protein [Curvibacter sp. CHRR-16]|uniref:ABC transporter substrate-binding protein n=1 Tax=Curvibacter sp. CHRR-16 TaxID=2835872 RepID=UPI001BDB046F|nr:helical backbone metal receptor [Curvibacter sp. CHRR-16]MBT0569216.1 ABC transporter substrate-binding protein [Curvibacter sp. CHRR-16]
MRRWPILRAWAWLALAASACSAWLPAHAYTVQDDRGVQQTFAAAPQRIVSLLPSLTETVCELGACARLVGVDRYSNYPASVTRLPQLGGGLDPNIEAIMALQPDVVLVAKSSRAGERLQALGLKVLAFEPKTHEDVQRIVLRLGDLLQVHDAQHIWRAIDAGVSAAAQSLPPAVRQLRVYFEVNEGPYAAGEASFIGQTLARLGVRNIVPASLGAFPRLNPEYVVRAEPDVILIGQRSVDGLASRPGWSQLKALRTGHVCAFAESDANVLVRPGPRMAEAARIMANCLAAQVKQTAKKGRAP